MQTTARSDSGSASDYAPFAQLIKMLLPSAGSVSIYDPQAELVWCSDGFEQPDLRALLEQQRASDTLASRGRVDSTSGGTPVFISGLRGSDMRPLGSLVISLGNGNSRSTPSMVVSMLRPLLDCLEGLLDRERSSGAAARSAGLELLLSADEDRREDGSALQDLLRQCTRELNCVTGALAVPDKGVELTCSSADAPQSSQLVDRTRKHLLAWARLNNRPMIVNRAGAGAPYKILSCPLRDPAGGVLGLVALFRAGDADDFEQRDVRILEYVSRKAVAILRSDYDALTGLANRFIFERRAQLALDRAPTTLLYIDVDKLAAINERFGLVAGDEVIQRIGALVLRMAGADALVSRLAGDRFAVAMPGRTLEDARALGTKIVAAAGQLGYVNGAEALPVSVSIGAVCAPLEERLQHALAAAELACKRAKAEGGARLAAVDAPATLTPVAVRQALAVTELNEALQSNQFQLDAQPIVTLAARGAATAGFELLVRMRSAAGETLAPQKFLAACVHHHLMPALDRWVLCAAVEALRPHAELLAGSPLFFAVNVSAQSIENRGYAAFALETLAAAKLPPSLFCFEIQETAAVTHLAAADALIGELRNSGAKVALDDFGAGLSSLAHLKKLPVSYLKIDGRFVRSMASDRIAESMVSGIARAAEVLGIPTIAEHVETAAVIERLRELEVGLGQGFELGVPQPLAQAVQHAVEAATAALLPNVEAATRA